LMLLWWQPMQLSIGPQLLFGFKLGGLMAVTACLLRRIQEQGQAVIGEGIQQPQVLPALSAAA